MFFSCYHLRMHNKKEEGLSHSGKNSRIRNVLLIGGTGFIGTHVLHHLKARGYRPYLLSRKQNASIETIQGSISNKNDVLNAISQVDAVINLAGLSPNRMPSKRNSYQDVHVSGVSNVVDAINQQSKNIPLVHVGALGADKESPNEYMKTKGEAIEIIRTSAISYTIINPSIVDGEGSGLDMTFKKLSFIKVIPVPKLTAKIQPVSVETLAKLIVKSLNAKNNQEIDAVGNSVITFYEYFRRLAYRNGLKTIPIPKPIIILGVKFLQIVRLLPRHTEILLETDNISSRFK